MDVKNIFLFYKRCKKVNFVKSYIKENVAVLKHSDLELYSIAKHRCSTSKK